MTFFRSTFFRLPFVALIAITFSACSDDDDAPVEIPKVTTGVYVLNEGLFNQNNSTLTYYDFTSKTPVTDFFGNTNDRGLGDSGNDAKIYGSKLYIVMNVSSQIEVVDVATGESVKQIPMFDEEVARQPRNIAFHKGYAYVCSFDGTVGRLDTATLVFDKFVKVGAQPDGIAVSNNKLYVSNSGGFNAPDYGNTVSVINIETFVETKTITVGTNPGSITADSDGDLYVITRGNYVDVAGSFQRINAQDDVVTTFVDLAASGVTIVNDKAYLYDYNYGTGETIVKVLDTKTESVITEDFIADDTAIASPYGIDVDPVNGDVYITDAINYTVSGDVFCFGADGKFKFSFEAGLNPNTVVFIQK